MGFVMDCDDRKAARNLSRHLRTIPQSQRGGSSWRHYPRRSLMGCPFLAVTADSKIHLVLLFCMAEAVSEEQEGLTIEDEIDLGIVRRELT